MADQDPLPDDEDPLLVRPYISNESAGTGTTWPSSAAQPVPSAGSHRADATVAFERPVAPAAEVAGRDRRRVLLIAGAGAVVVLALAGAGFAALRPDDSGPAPVGAPPAGPVATGSAPTPSPSTATSPSPGSPAPPAATAAALPPVATATTTRPPARSPEATTAAATTPPAAPASAAPTLSLAPAVARIGTVVGAGGLCLDLNGGVPADGNHVQVFTCNGSDAQRWTLATDGTLRVAGRCAQVTGDATVHIIGCDSRAAAQWRAGPDRSLVNADRCLTDPRAGAAVGTGVVVAACTGAAGQRWSLP